jgi:L-threonylcarbamoyladenylate synthase
MREYAANFSELFAMTPLESAAKVLSQGGVIAYPTEGVWGLGCDPFNESAVFRILALKQRPAAKGLILAAGNARQVEMLIAQLPEDYRDILDRTWPGPNTWLIPDVDQLIPHWVKGEFDTVALRVSAHPLVAQLCDCFGGMIVSTSANPADKPPALTQAEVEAYFPGSLDFVLPGELGDQSGPSTIRDLMSQLVIRQ